MVKLIGCEYFPWMLNIRINADEMQWLERLDPTKEHYLGAHVQGSADFFFAYGGAGFVLSAAAIKKVVGPKGGFGASWDQRMVEQCKLYS